MDNTIRVVLTLGGADVVLLLEPLNPDASILTGLDVTVKGTLVGDVGTGPADTELCWRPAVPVVVPQEEA